MAGFKRSAQELTNQIVKCGVASKSAGRDGDQRRCIALVDSQQFGRPVQRLQAGVSTTPRSGDFSHSLPQGTSGSRWKNCPRIHDKPQRASQSPPRAWFREEPNVRGFREQHEISRCWSPDQPGHPMMLSSLRSRLGRPTHPLRRGSRLTVVVGKDRKGEPAERGIRGDLRGVCTVLCPCL